MQDDKSADNRRVVPKLELEEHLSESGESDEDSDTGESEEEASDKEERLSMLDVTMLTVKKLSDVHNGKTPTCRNMTLDLLKSLYTLAYKDQPAMEEFDKTLASASDLFTFAPYCPILAASEKQRGVCTLWPVPARTFPRVPQLVQKS
ncbi:uncharacterized protein LOC117827528 [Xyrichtys novacula]|uniref:Uncharacterized protein LOC117827528 n=1 Tax=Xyrichtys novacula TaxID=13765 RepID=A0AAV1HBY2_XYRNO|nr:uncharacterized protein LOC117827528 [Xyrichtys novacula]